MTMVFENVGSKIKPVFRFVGKEAEKQGLRSYVVGGFVRDASLHRPGLDIDVVIEGDAVLFVRKLRSTKIKSVKIHPQFKTATVQFKNSVSVDFASARSEVYDHSGALPKVRLGSLREDLFRRDFTINTLAVCLNPKQFGEVVDLYGGMDDLKKKRVRFLHDQSFADDPTRILRAVRYEQRLAFRIEPKTLKSLKTAIKKNFVKRVSPVRYFNEFKKILCEDKPKKHLLRLKGLGGYGFLGKVNLKEKLLAQVERRIQSLQQQKGLKDFRRWWVIYLAACLPENYTADRLKAFNIAKEDRIAISDCLKLKQEAKKLDGLSSGEIYVAVHRYDLAAVVYQYCVGHNPKAVRKFKKYLASDRFTKLKINGTDIKSLGVPQGRKIKNLLEELFVQKIEKRLKGKKEELRAVRNLLAVSSK